MPRYKIFTEWRKPDGTTERESVGLTLGADDENAACEMAHRRGTVWGLGFNPRYIGLVAVAIDE